MKFIDIIADARPNLTKIAPINSEKWDSKTAERIVAHLEKLLCS